MRQQLEQARSIAFAAVLFLGGCAASQPEAALDAATSPDGGSACPTRPSTATGSPASIAEAVALVNGLRGDRPSLSIQCFLSTLDRPLKVVGAISTFSLQASVDSNDPRIFIQSGNLIMSVLPSGTNSWQIELAEVTTPLRSMKAQLEFPAIAPVSAAAPYDSVRLSGAGTICGSCHAGEQLAPQITATQAFESNIIQPRPSTLVSLDWMQNLTATCDPTQDPDRCAILTGVFGHGAVVEGAFPPDAQTF